MDVWLGMILVLAGAIVAAFASPWPFLFLALAIVAALLPRAEITLPLSCVLGAIASIIMALAKPVVVMNVGLTTVIIIAVWIAIHLALYFFVAAGLWRRKR